MKLKVFKADGSSSTEKDFPNFPEFEGDRGIATLRQVVIAQQANKRQGNASTKTRAEVAGSGKKLFRQKGSGTARQGTRRVPHQRHGGVAHGPKPRDYSQKTNRKMRQLAMQRALFDRAIAGKKLISKK
jgi:large subunit ribosomal protein L4